MALYYEEKVILDYPQGSLEVNHLILKGTNYAIGKKLGELARERHKIQKPGVDDPLRSRCQRLYMQKNYPIFFERMAGIGDAYGVNPEKNESFDFSLLGELNNRIGCSAIYYPPHTTETGHGIISRNLDFFASGNLNTILGLETDNGLSIPPLAKPYILEIHPDKGYPSMTIMSFELFGEALEGINSEGLTVVHLADDESLTKYPMEPAMSNAVGLHEFKSIQLLLDTCADVQEAKQALLTNKHFYMFTPIHLLIADRHGNSFVWEYSHAHNKEYIIEGNGYPQIVTNHLLHRYQTIMDLPHESKDTGCSYNRYRTLNQAITTNPSRYTLDFIKETNALVFINDDSFSLLNSPPLPIRTLLHTIYDTDERSLQISFHLRDEMKPERPEMRNSLRSDYFKFNFRPYI